MQNSKTSSWNSNFSHVYIEKGIINHPNTKKILSHFKNSIKVEIDHYKDVFCRGKQSFVMQKQSLKLILAEKKDSLIYEGAEVCEDFGNSHFYYTSTIMNCIYDCEYCYLQGMYPSAIIVIFVNIEEIFKEIEELLKDHPVYLCISYDSDLLALERVTNFTSKWMEFVSKHKDLKIELRTKSANFKSIRHIEPLDNFILAWTLSPDEVTKEHEAKTPTLDLRLQSAKEAIEKGWKVRICFDPLLYVSDWKVKYNTCIEKTFMAVSPDKILDVSIGVFRVSKDYLKKMRKGRDNSLILSYPYEVNNGVCTYWQKHSNPLIEFVYNKVCEYVPKEKIYI